MTNFSGMNHRLELISLVPLTSTTRSLENIFHTQQYVGFTNNHRHWNYGAQTQKIGWMQ